MTGLLRAVAVDFDGTLTTDGSRPRDDVLQALTHARDRGITIVLVTGRILTELREVFPDVDAFVDAVVAENGAVIWHDGAARDLATPVDPELIGRLRHEGVHVRAGRVLVAASAAAGPTILAALRDLGLGAQIVLNRSELMVVPAGVTKGTGLDDVLADLGVSHHNTIGIGDAENDHALLDVCEVAAVVGNAVPALRRNADLALRGTDGDGIVELLDGPILAGRRPAHSPRWQIRLGADADGGDVCLPASQINILVCGATGVGKSYCTGLIAERLVSMGYSVAVLDPEGDHRGLARMRGPVLVDLGSGPVPPARVTDLLCNRFSSVVLDLSAADPADRWSALGDLATHLLDLRARRGLPHWIVADEAHFNPASLLSAQSPSWTSFRGYCLSTYRPGDLDPELIPAIDAVIALPGGAPLPDDAVAIASRVSGLPEALIRHHAGGLGTREAVLARRPALGPLTTLALATRATPQVRHQHKYGTTPLAPDRWFRFRDGQDTLVEVATTLTDLARILRAEPVGPLLHHAAAHDISRWVHEVYRDDELAAALQQWETQAEDGIIDPRTACQHMTQEVTRRYPG